MTWVVRCHRRQVRSKERAPPGMQAPVTLGFYPAHFQTKPPTWCRAS
ncbi:hypothetical protein [Actinomadura formosensis]|nr:hypothetical protein [Actinomadura formosensis]